MSIVTILAALNDQTPITVGTGGIQNLPTGSANDFLHSGLTIVYGLAGTVAVIIIIVAGFMYTTSGGDSSRIKKAKDAILYSLIGLILVALAFVITQFVIGAF
jgi:type IV secretory pathway VirB2 component (pilin)